MEFLGGDIIMSKPKKSPRMLGSTQKSRKIICRPWLPSPPPLIELSSKVVNNLPLPVCWNWDVHLVRKWLWTTIKLPDYKQILQGIRDLYKIEREKYDRCISLPPRFPWTHYLFYRSPTGPIRENTKATKLFRKMGIINTKEIGQQDHWDMMEPEQPDFPSFRFGYAKSK